MMQRRQQPPMSLDYEVIATGSEGNCVRIENIMIDCGISYSKLHDALYKVNTLLITHTHSDHIKEATYSKIRKEFPRVQICGNSDVAYQYKVDRIIGTQPFKVKGAEIIPFEGLHDVPVTYFIIKMHGLNIFYATDTCRVENPDRTPLDYIFLESNYDERKLKELSKQYRRKWYDPQFSNIRHLSTQKCKEFYYVNRRNADSPLIELHMSKRFY
jgi:Cft2 family RNA processing exonuclease